MLRLLNSLLTSRLVWGAAIVSLLSIVIWSFGPALVIRGERPLADENNRLLLIAAICVLFIVGYVLLVAWRAWRRRAVRSRAVVKTYPAPGRSEPPTDDSPTLKQGFEDALRLLRRAHIGRLPWYSPRRWWRRLGQGHLYLRPWYLVFGGPGSGKTTLLGRSQLHFPFAELFGKSSQRKVGATRQCDWWLTDEAVLLDAAGDYVWQESAQAEPARQWGLFLRLLRKCRPRQPLNGVLLTVSMEDLLSASADERHEQARSLHKRLQELHERLRIRFPVYVVVTKADLLSGFVPYFEGLDAEQRRQVWGFTFAEETVRAPDFELAAGFDEQFESLRQRLTAGLPETLASQPQLAQRARAYLLSQQFAGLREILRGYLETVFSFSSFETRLLPRGVYFTSATQAGTAEAAAESAERLPGALNDPLHASVPRQDDSRPFFIQDLFERAVFKESGLAGSNRWWELRNAGLHWAGYAVLALLLTLAGTLWWLSYRNNLAYLDEVALQVPPVEQQGARLNPVGQQELFRLLPYLEALRRLPDSAAFTATEPPLMHRLGLYRGKPVKAAGQTLYQRALDTLLQPLVAAQIRDILENDDHQSADFSYQALKAYRMLFDGEHYDAEFLQAWLSLNLRRRHAGSASASQAQWVELDGHLGRLLDQETLHAPFVRDPELEAKTSAHLNQVPLSQRVYDRLKRTVEKSGDLRPLNLIDLAGAQAEVAFRRPSGRSMVDGIPGLYTRNGYWNAFDKQLVEATRTLSSEDAWIIGTAGQPASADELAKAVRELYMRDFIAHWDGLLNDIALGNVASVPQRVQMARLLSSPDSPMRRLLVNAAANLQLAKEDPKGGTGDARSKPAGLLESMFPSIDTEAIDFSGAPESMVARHYRALLELARSEDGRSGGSIAFDRILKQVDDLYNYLSTLQGAANSGLPTPASDVIGRLQAEAERLPPPFQPMLRSLAVGASSDTQSSEMSGIKKRIGSEVSGFCQRAIAGRYPLSRESSQDITAEDFARMFAPGNGLMDRFFQQNLAGKVDTSRASWRFNPGIDGQSLPGGEGALRPFQQAQAIRDTFFASGQPTPSFRVTLKPVGMDSDILSLSLDVDGQTLQYSHGPLVSQTVSWPGTQKGMRVGLQLNLANGSSASLSTTGDWALHRFFDRARLSPGSSPAARIASFDIEGHKLRLELQPTSVRDPFSPPPFSCK